HGQPEYDLVGAPGADPRQIVLALEGAARARVDAVSGDLLIETADGALVRHARPTIYQQSGDRRESVQGHYRLTGGTRVAFELNSYDPRRPLIIDPNVVFTTWMEGNGNEHARGIAIDGAMNSYIVGQTDSTN